jgi:hypothetical protein
VTFLEALHLSFDCIEKTVTMIILLLLPSEFWKMDRHFKQIAINLDVHSPSMQLNNTFRNG